MSAPPDPERQPQRSWRPRPAITAATSPARACRGGRAAPPVSTDREDPNPRRMLDYAHDGAPKESVGELRDNAEQHEAQGVGKQVPGSHLHHARSAAPRVRQEVPEVQIVRRTTSPSTRACAMIMRSVASSGPMALQ